ncbi:MAG: hypothetical protein ACOYYS_19295 [Chloroflexota bacterium]
MNPIQRTFNTISRTVRRLFSAWTISTKDSKWDRQLLHRDTYPRDRLPQSRDEVLSDVFEAWRTNAMARRIVDLTTQYVIGAGIKIECPEHEETHKFLQRWWAHPQNNMDHRLPELCDELSRSGELFPILSTDYSGMTYVRAVPAIDILDIETAIDDIEQAIAIYEKPRYDTPRANIDTPFGLAGRAWPAYRPALDYPTEHGEFTTVALHYPVNRPIGAIHGESDLAPIVKWLVRYSSWLEDRARLNRYRNIFNWFVKGNYKDSAERIARQNEINANPPPPGSIIVHDASEEWDVKAPKLESHEAGEDGLAIKKMVAAGSGTPLHFLAEPESATRTTAEAAGGPTYRHYEQRQRYFLGMLHQLATVAVRRRAQVDHRVSVRAEIVIKAGDISARDNSSLSLAAQNIEQTFERLRAMNLVDDTELLRMTYRFAGENVDVTKILERGKAAPKIELPGAAPNAARRNNNFDPETGEERI